MEKHIDRYIIIRINLVNDYKITWISSLFAFNIYDFPREATIIRPLVINIRDQDDGSHAPQHDETKEKSQSNVPKIDFTIFHDSINMYGFQTKKVDIIS